MASTFRVSRFWSNSTLSCSCLELMCFSCSILSANVKAQEIPVYGYNVKHVYPHDPSAFTQGLFYLDGYLYESTGKVGQSTIRKVELKTGKVLQIRNFPDHVFGEGIVSWDKTLVGLSWKKQIGFEWDLESFTLKNTFKYKGEGWGLTRNSNSIIMSDGTSAIRFINPVTKDEIHRITVTANGEPITRLNELEWVKNEILANIWGTNYIAKIDPINGKVKGVINLSGILAPYLSEESEPNVLNGIAIDNDGNLIVTGKYWPKLFVISLTKENPQG